MFKQIPVDTLHHVTVVTRDARETAREHARFYGIASWDVVEHSPERLRRTAFRGRGKGSADLNRNLLGKAAAPGEFGFLSVRGTVPSGGLTFEIIQPTVGLSTFEHFLATRGPGIHSLCLSVVKPEDEAPLRAFLDTQGVPLAQRFALDDSVDHLYFDTRKALGGFYLQVVVASRDDWAQVPVADEVWDFSADVPQADHARALQAATGARHFGVVVDDLDAYLPN